jgi:lantibiotic transport system permease protein
LITQLEFRNNSWKQLHTTPQPLTTIFFAKLSVILVMMAQLFVLFNICIYVAGVLPPLVCGVEIPRKAFPFWYFFEKSYYFFLACLPIIAFQYLISLQFKNFLVPLGLGLGFQVASLIALEWKYGYTIPYTYSPYSFFMLRGGEAMLPAGVNIHNWALGYFVFFTAVSYVLYIFQKEKG